MSTNSTTPSALLPPAGTNFIAVITAGMPFLLTGATMGSIHLAMLFALLFFSTPHMRRTPMFILNVVALLLGITNAIINIYIEIRSFEYPTIPVDPNVIICMGALGGLTPLFRTPKIQWYLVLGVPILIKVGRLANDIIFLVYLKRDIDSLISSLSGVGGASILLTATIPSIKVEWIFQVVDDVFSSALFLWRVYRQGMFSHGQTLSQKVQQLFWISTYNFVFPVILSVAQIVIYMLNPDNYLLALYVEEVNFGFTIMGLVFATVWAAEGQWKEGRRFHGGPSTRLSAMMLGPSSTFDPHQKREVIVFAPPSSETSVSRPTDSIPRSSLAATHDGLEESNFSLVERGRRGSATVGAMHSAS
ncbi:hypothetical protein F5I97DRAFT_1937263 [Phlebopus sp. FC_14]|nr:hypothetical protein F5I97DRAFT_1937263 [Phlebopus sp. FC_14]